MRQVIDDHRSDGDLGRSQDPVSFQVCLCFSLGWDLVCWFRRVSPGFVSLNLCPFPLPPRAAKST